MIVKTLLLSYIQKNSDIVYQKTLEKKLHIENLGTICICRYEHVEIKL